MTPRDIHKMAVGQVAYTGWCDDEGRMLDDGTISRLADDKFRMTSAEPSLRWLGMNAIGMDVTITEVTDQVAALSLQGPKSRAILNRVCKKSLDKLKDPQSFARWLGTIVVHTASKMRRHERVLARFGFARSEPVDADVFVNQGVAIGLADVAPGEVRDFEVLVILRVVVDDMGGELQ